MQRDQQEEKFDRKIKRIYFSKDRIMGIRREQREWGRKCNLVIRFGISFRMLYGVGS